MLKKNKKRTASLTEVKVFMSSEAVSISLSVLLELTISHKQELHTNHDEAL